MAPTGEDKPEPLWPLKEIAVSGLFGDRNFSIYLDPEATVLTGENGSGKSTLLRGLHLLSIERWQEFARLPLRALRLSFEHGMELEVEASEDGLAFSSSDHKWTFSLDRAAQLDPSLLTELRRFRHRATSPRRQREQAWAREALWHRGGLASDEIDDLVTPEWLNELTDRFHTKMISARRLEHRLQPDPGPATEDTPVPVVEQFAKQLRDRMRDQLSAYAAESRRQEKNLPAQIVKAMQEGPSENPESVADEVSRLRSDVRDLADSLAQVGLFQEEDPEQQFAEYPRDNPPILLAVREVYRVTKERLERLTALRTDLELFSSFLNQRLSNKFIELSQDTGIEVVLRNGEYIRPSQLSSGEQQLLALAYELLFGTEHQSLVLLDEPELSLHVAWLQGLLAAFLDMGRSQELQFLIATHSPSVLVGHKELERSLDLTDE